MRVTPVGCCIGRCILRSDAQATILFMEYSEEGLSGLNQTVNWKCSKAACNQNLVWDECILNSLKASARQKRGTGARRRVLPFAMVLRNWQEFLRLDNKKKELFLFVSEQVVRTAIKGKQIIVIRGEEVLCSPPATRRNKLSPCSHEKEDTRMMVHIADAVQDGHQSIMIRSTDTDVVGLVVTTLDLKELWVYYGTRKNHRILLAHLFAKALGPSKSKSLPIFHALTGCDTTSFFAG